jgi:hypothetical protein
VIVLSPLPYYIAFELETPKGTRINPGVMSGLGTGLFAAGQTTTFYRAGLPAIPADPGGSHADTWYAVLRLNDRVRRDPKLYLAQSRETQLSTDQDLVDMLKQGNLPYDLLVHTYSNLNFAASSQQSSYQLGSTVQILASLREYDVPIEKRASVWAEVTLPPGSQMLIKLDETAPGDFVGTFTTSYNGLYKIRIRAQGETFYGTAFTREQTSTAYAVIGEGTPREGQARGYDDLFCQFTECLVESGAISNQVRERLQELGVDLDVLLKCLEGRCHDLNIAARLERRSTHDLDAKALLDMLTGTDISKLKALLEALVQPH